MQERRLSAPIVHDKTSPLIARYFDCAKHIEATDIAKNSQVGAAPSVYPFLQASNVLPKRRAKSLIDDIRASQFQLREWRLPVSPLSMRSGHEAVQFSMLMPQNTGNCGRSGSCSPTVVNDCLV
jgi:hypothetical protein